MCGQNVKRYLNLLDTPMEVQRAVTQKTLAMTLATRVGSLKKPVKDRIAAAIRAGRDPTDVVTSMLPERKPKAADPGDVLGLLIDALERMMEALAGREDEITRRSSDLAHDHAVLKRFAAFSRQLRPLLEARKEEME
jgi:hypothetical protein